VGTIDLIYRDDEDIVLHFSKKSNIFLIFLKKSKKFRDLCDHNHIEPPSKTSTENTLKLSPALKNKNVIKFLLTLKQLCTMNYHKRGIQ